jgi:hypothetical protein
MFNNLKRSTFPPQQLPLSKKTKEWKEKCVDAIVGRANSFASERDRMRTNYDLYNGIFNEADLKYVTNPFKVEDSFPASLQNFNIIRPKINLLLGEESKRPNNILVYQTNDDAGSKTSDKMAQMILDTMLQEVQKSMQEGGDGNSEESQKAFEAEVQKITNYVISEYVNPAEVTAHSSLEYLRMVNNLDDIFLKGLKDGLIGGKEIHYVGIHSGEPIAERVNPLEFSHDNDPELDNIEDGDWAVRHMKMTPSAIYDRFNDIMTESDLTKVNDLIEGRGVSAQSEDQFNRIEFKSTDTASPASESNLQASYVDVWHATWRSFKKVGFVHSPGDTPEEGDQVDMVDELYKPAEGETVESDWVTEIWEGYRLGDDIYVGIQPLAYQDISIETPNNAKLPYVGSLYSDTNSTNRSLVDVMKPLAYMYIIIWYRLELALSRDKGKILNMDITQIPKSMNVDVNKWLHYLTALGVNFINPYEEGWDVPGREGGRPAQFNQISSQDLTMTNVIANYIDLMNKIEEMIGELSGVSRQRQGSISSSELVGNVERSVIQSSHITEVLFWTHNNIKKRVYTQLLEAAKTAWRDSNRQHLYYVLNDMSRKFVKLDENFPYTSYGVFITDSSKEFRNIEALKTLLQPAMQNGATLLDAASIMTADNMNQIKKRLEEVDKKRDQMAQAEQQAKAQMQQQMVQAEQQRAAADLALRQQEMEFKEEDSIRKAETQIAVAQISAASTGSEMGQPPEVDELQNDLDQQKLRLEQEKAQRDFQVKQKQIDETVRKNKQAEEFKAQEIAIKRKVANKPTPRPAAKR